MKRRILMTLCSLLAAAGAGPAAAQTVTVALNADIRSVNPGVNRDDNTDTVVLHLVEGLVALKENGTVGPLLASKVSTSPDGLTYTFTLRKGVKFHNGEPLAAADVLWSWNRYMDPKTDWRCLSEFDGRSGLKVESATAPDPQTVVMRINKPSALFLDTLARTDCAMAGVIHKSSVNPDGSFKAPIGTGPFKLGEWKRAEYIVLNRFDGYVSPPGSAPDGYTGAKRPLVEAVKFIVIPDTATTKAALISGAVDVAEIQTTDMLEVQRAATVEVKTNLSANKRAFLFQTRDPLMGNPKIRQAIAASLDTQPMVSSLTRGLTRSNASVIHRSSPYYSDVQRQLNYTYDPVLAKKLLQEAGYKGEKIKLLANKRPGGILSFDMALMAQQMMQAVGLNVEIEVLEWATQLDRYNKGNYQMMAFSYSARLDPALSFEQFTGPKDKEPRKVWESPEALDLLEKASTISNEAERGKLFDQMHKRFMADVPMIKLYNSVDIFANQKRVQGFTLWAASKPRLWEVSLAK
jgi:peptide/nickel transport system substrate-binding protein